MASVVVLGVAITVMGAVLAIFATVKGAKIRNYVVKNELAPDLTRPYYLTRFYFPAICAVYVKTTGDRVSVRLAVVIGILGLLLLIGGGMLAGFWLAK
jgi:hypothetical protein